MSSGRLTRHRRKTTDPSENPDFEAALEPGHIKFNNMLEFGNKCARLGRLRRGDHCAFSLGDFLANGAARKLSLHSVSFFAMCVS